MISLLQHKYLWIAMIGVVLLISIVSCTSGTPPRTATTEPTNPTPGKTKQVVPAGDTSTLSPTIASENTNTPFLVATNKIAASTTQYMTPTHSRPMISADVTTNCRAGTSVVFEILGLLSPNDSVEVHGRSPDGQWWYIQNPNKPNEFCWVWTETTIVSGDLSQVPVVEPPPLPTATLTLVPIDSPTPTLTATVTPTNTLIPIDTPTITYTAVISPQPPTPEGTP